MQQKQETIFENPRFVKNEHELKELEDSKVYLPYKKIQLLKENIKSLEEALNYYDDEHLQIHILAKLGEYNGSLSEVLLSIANPTKKDEAEQFKHQMLAQEYNPQAITNVDREQQDSDYSLAVYLNEEQHLTQIKDDELLTEAVAEIEKQDVRSPFTFFNSVNTGWSIQVTTEEPASVHTMK